jgi:hypothetical protein
MHSGDRLAHLLVRAAGADVSLLAMSEAALQAPRM